MAAEAQPLAGERSEAIQAEGLEDCYAAFSQFRSIRSLFEEESHIMTPFAAVGLSRRRFLQAAGAVAAFGPANPVWADAFVELALPGGPDQRSITSAFPQKGAMVLQRTRPPLLETPFEVFDRGVFTSNDQFFVRWHWALIPTQVDVAAFKLTVRGQVIQTLSLSMADLLAMPRVEIAAVNQCSGNSRGLFQPRVPGGQWGNGAWAMRAGPAFVCVTCSIARE